MLDADDAALQGNEAAPFRVLCFSDDADSGPGHDHVAFVETSDPHGGSTRWRAIDVIAAIRDGFRFVVAHDGVDALVEPTVCPACTRATVSVDPSVPRPVPC